ncbi:hypothetical protein ACIGNX_14595 [Actinosynnema sp. NPDC053489]|uniref:hypothetical protein n=1 Tax=Actinosynnema sp. NPDC053489 TaxID=3363916 RepID=UPI0037C9D27A
MSRHLSTTTALAASLVLATTAVGPRALAAPGPVAPGPVAAAACASSTLPLPTGVAGGAVTAADGAGGWAGAGYVPVPFGGRATHALRWSGGAVTDLGTLAGQGDDAVVTGVNRAGTVVGYAPGVADRAFRSNAGKLEALPVPAGTDSSRATGVNDSGDVVGDVGVDLQQGVTVYTVHTAVLWPAAAPGTVVALPGLPTTGQTKAVGVDQDGTVLVEHYPSRTDAFAATGLLLWRAGTARRLALPSGSATVQGTSVANGRVTGTTHASATADGRGVLWEHDGTPLRPAGSGALHSVNRAGRSVGWTTDTALTWAVWQLGTLVTTVPGTLGLAVAADSGEVAGWSRVSGQQNKPTVWRC